MIAKAIMRFRIINLNLQCVKLIWLSILMKKATFLTYICIIILFSGCSAQKPDQKKAIESSQNFNEQMIIKPLQVMEINAIQITGTSVKLQTTAQTPDVCWEFSHYDIHKETGKWFITIYGKRDPAKICVQMIGTLKVEVNLDFPNKGRYECLFWKSESDTLHQTILLD